jgi:hypothetical protein
MARCAALYFRHKTSRPQALMNAPNRLDDDGIFEELTPEVIDVGWGVSGRRMYRTDDIHAVDDAPEYGETLAVGIACAAEIK